MQAFREPWSSIQLLLLDLDNTLCNTYQALSLGQWRKVAAVLDAKGWGGLRARIDKQFGQFSFAELLHQCRATPTQRDFCLALYRDVELTPLRLYDDVESLLALDLPKVLISRGHHELQWQKLRHLEIAERFDEVVIVSPDDCKQEAAEAALARYRMTSSQALIIGDRLFDEIQAGKRLRIPTILIDRQERPACHARVWLKPDMVLHSLDTITEALSESSAQDHVPWLLPHVPVS